MTAMHVVGAIIIDDGRVLSCRRAAHKASAGLWEFPGGKVHGGESSFEAIRRELLEELALEVTPIATFNRASTQVGDLVIDLETVICRPKASFQGSSTDHDDCRWLVISDLASIKWAAPDVPAVDLLGEVKDLQSLLETR